MQVLPIHSFNGADQYCACGAGPYEAHRKFLPDHEVTSLADLIRATPIPHTGVRHDRAKEA